MNERNENRNRVGYWEEYYSTGVLWRKGNYINGRRDGYWEFHYPNRKITYKGSYIYGIQDGYWIKSIMGGSIIEEEYYI